MKIKIFANELVDSSVTYVSLVKHGANRTPFAILKQEDDLMPEPWRGLMPEIDKLRDRLAGREVENMVTKADAPQVQKEDAERALQVQKLTVRRRLLNDQWMTAVERASVDPVSRKLLEGIETELAKCELELSALVNDEAQIKGSSAFFRRGGQSFTSHATCYDSAFDRSPSMRKAEQVIDLNSPLTMSEHEGIDFSTVDLKDRF